MSKENNKNAQQGQLANTPEAIAASQAFIERHKNLFISLLVILVLLIAGFFLTRNWLQERENKAQSQLTLGQTFVQQQDYEKALKGSGKFIGFEKLANDYNLTDASNIAKLWAGICYAKKGDFKNAISYLERFSTKKDHTVSPAALATLANCYAETDQVDKAIETFKKAAKLADNEVTSPEYLLQAAELLQSQNKQEEARALYEKIKTDFSGSGYSQQAVDPNTGVVLNAAIDAFIESTKK